MVLFLQNIKTLCISTMYSSFEWVDRVFDINNDGTFSKQETRDFLKSPEAMSIAENGEKESLKAASILLRENVDLHKWLDAMEIRTIQFVCIKILKLEWKDSANASIDGLSGPNTRQDIESASGIPVVGREITAEHLEALVLKAESLSIIDIPETETISEETPIEEAQISPEEALESPTTLFDEIEKFEEAKIITIESGDTFLAKLKSEGFTKAQRTHINAIIEEKFDIETDTLSIWDRFTFTNPEDGVFSVSIRYKREELGEMALEDAVVTTSASWELPVVNRATWQLPINIASWTLPTD